MIELGANRYGKAAIRIVRVGRDSNDRTVYVATTEPHGLIEATVRRSEVS